MEHSDGSLQELLPAELRLAPGQWEEREGPTLAGQVLEADCLVHEEWLSCAVAGLLLSPHVPPMCPEEVHWLLQPSSSSNSAPKKPWQRIHISCIRKVPAPGRNKSLLVPQYSGYSLDSIHAFLTQVAQENILLSWREVLQLLQPPPQHTSSPRTVTSVFIKQLLKQLYNMDLKYLSTGEDETDSNQVSDQNRNETAEGSRSRTKYVSSSSEQDRQREQREPGVHPGLCPLIAALETKQAYYLLSSYQRFTLSDIVTHSPAMLEDSVAKPLFVMFQLLKLLEHCHSMGVTLGELSLKNIFTDSRLWIQMRLPLSVVCQARQEASAGQSGNEQGPDGVNTEGGDTGMDVDAALSPSVPVETGLDEQGSPPPHDNDSVVHSFSYTPPALHLADAVEKWRCGELSNFDYLMLLNYYAGRRVGEPNNHPILPWVMDFTHRNSGFRDLSRSKHRLSKGDRQLDFTYMTAQEEVRRAPEQDTIIPHHIGDVFSDVTYYVYLARRIPQEVLCSHVRPRWVPEEYPSSLEKMFVWSPDECIPEYFVDPVTFKSIHPDLPDLAVPSWCSSPEECISVHRGVLESDAVSSQLHHWIDLLFGYKLSGEAAVRAKNVYLCHVDKHKNPKSCGIVQLFRSSHPKRLQKFSAPLIIFEWQSYLNMSSVMNVDVFPIGSEPQGSEVTASDHASSSEPDTKTLGTFLSQQTAPAGQGDSPGSTADGPQHDNLEDDSSFEHVPLPNDPRGKAGSGTHSGPNGNIGIEYSDIPAAPFDAKKQKEGAVLNAIPTHPNRFRMPVVNYIFRQRKSNPDDTLMEVYDWQNAKVALPRDSNLLLHLSRLDDLGHFVTKSCKDHGSLFREQWEAEDMLLFQDSQQNDFTTSCVQGILEQQGEDPGFLPSFEERVAIDIISLACTVVEMCCMRQMRSAFTSNASLQQRIGTIRRLLHNGQLRIPSYLRSLVDTVLYPEDDLLSSRDINLPSLSANLLLQSFIPIVPFPSYFGPLYKFLHKLEQFCRESSLQNRDLKELAIYSQELAIQRSAKDGNSTLNTADLNRIISFISDRLETLLRLVNSEGFMLLLLHLFPLFQYPETCFEAVCNHMDILAQYMSKKNAERLFATPVIRLFDSPIEPYQRGHLLSRSMADVLIRRFGLSTYLVRFLGFLIEAVIEPLRISSKGFGQRINANLFRLQSESVLTLVESDLFQSMRFDEGKRPPHMSDFTWSMGISEGRTGYDSDKEECSSVESDSFDLPEASLLAKSGMVLGSLAESQTDEEGSRPSSMHLEQDVRILERLFANEASTMFGEQGQTHDQPETETRTDDIARDSTDHSLLALPPMKGTLFDDSLGFAASGLQEQEADSLSLPPHLGLSTNASITSSIVSTQTYPDVRSPYGSLSSKPVLALGRNLSILGEEVEESEEDEHVFKDNSISSTDPQTRELNVYISEVSADCLCWLIRRLGPFLTTRHIVKPLLEGLHRCFTGVLHLHRRESMAVRTLAAVSKHYGEEFILKLYLPHAENLVTAATSKMTVKSEAGVAASIALAKISVQLLSEYTLERISLVLCDNYFIPVIQLLSSHTTFPSGGKARAAICHSIVKLLIQIGRSLGREKASEAMIGTLQCFFATFSGVHQAESHEGSRRNGRGTALEDESLRRTPTEREDPYHKMSSKVVPETTEVDSHPLSTSGDSEVESELQRATSILEDTEAYKQQQATFTPAMAHAAYIPFCQLLGQIKLNSVLYNTDLIENIAYGHDKIAQPNSPLPCIWDDSDAELEASSESNSDASTDDQGDDSFSDAALKLGPVTAIQSKSGLGKDAANFGRPSWFVDLREGEQEEVGAGGKGEEEERKEEKKEEERRSVLKGAAAGFLHFWGSRSSPEMALEHKRDSLGRYSANFDAKFSSVQSHSSPDSKTGGSSSLEDVECTLQGTWASLWEAQLQMGPYSQEPYNHCRGLRLQTFSGHKSTVRALAVADSEHYFVSGSKDKTVKIWTLRNHGDGSASLPSQYTYAGHQKPLVEVKLMEMMGSVLSCDGSVHMWDPETGYCIQQFSSPRGTQFVTMETLPQPHPVIAVATSDLLLRFIDVRARSHVHLWKLQFSTGGIVRTMACFDNWIAVGNYNGWVNILDIRTGEMLHSWKPAYSPPVPNTTWNESLLQVKATKRGNLISSTWGGLLSLWKPTQGKLLHYIWGQSANTSCLEVMGEQLVTASAGHVVVHSSFELAEDAPYMATRIRSRELRGGMSALAVLQENRLLLVGGDSGQILLMA